MVTATEQDGWRRQQLTAHPAGPSPASSPSSWAELLCRQDVSDTRVVSVGGNGHISWARPFYQEEKKEEKSLQSRKWKIEPELDLALL